MKYGQIEMPHEEVRELQNDLVEFQNSEKDAIFVMFIGALNHWSIFIAHKSTTKGSQISFTRGVDPHTIEPSSSRYGARGPSKSPKGSADEKSSSNISRVSKPSTGP